MDGLHAAMLDRLRDVPFQRGPELVKFAGWMPGKRPNS